MKTWVTVFVALLLTSARLGAFSAEGHKTIAAIASSQLSDQAKAAVTSILAGESMIDASVWLDEIKPPFGALAKTEEAHQFNHDHPDNKKWHYVNFPIGARSYSASSPFAYPHDVVHIINGCVNVLEGGSYEGLTKKEALRCLIHVVGDLHQPLHVAAGYFDVADPNHPQLLKTVAGPDAAVSDAGGNDLYYGSKAELHAFWDKNLVNAVYSTNDPTVLAQHVMDGVDPSKYKTAGVSSTWAAKWAGDSMRIAKGIYADMELGEATLDAHGDLKRISITLSPTTHDYEAKYTPIEAEQLRKGGCHLAQLLNSIQWEEADVADATPAVASNVGP